MDTRKYSKITACLFAAAWFLGLIALPVGAQLGGSLNLGDDGAVLGQDQGQDLIEADGEFLHPDKAFIMDSSWDSGSLHVTWQIAEGYYMYRDKIEFKSAVEGVQFAAPELAEAKIKDDPYFGPTPIYKNHAEASVALGRASDAVPDQVEVTVTYQGCAEGGICYPPIKKKVPFSFNGLIRSVAAAEPASGSGPGVAEPIVNEADEIVDMLSTKAPWVVLGIFYGAGLLLSFTPCVFPMIPILSGIIAGQGSGLSTRGAFTLSAVYVAAMASAYAIAGVIAGLFGHNLQASFQHPAALITFSAVFVALALSMFGLYKLQLPSSITNKLESVSRNRQGGTVAGVAVMGFISAIIVGPCVAPPLAGALAYIGGEGSPVLGGAALFTLGLGMGTPLLAIGTSAGTLLPRAGTWMVSVQYVFGVTMLGVAVWFLSRIIPAPATLALWGLLLIGTSIYLGAFDQLASEVSGWYRLRKGFGLATVCYGALLIVGAAAGGDDPLQPLKSFAGGGGLSGASSAPRVEFTRVRNVGDLQSQISAATAAGKPVMLDFYADWCVECIQMERNTFSDPAVQSEFEKMVILQADVTDNNDADQELLSTFGLYGPPAILFYDAAGNERRELRVIGFANVDQFLARLHNLQTL